MNGLYNRSLLKFIDFTFAEINNIIFLSANLKQQKHQKNEKKQLIGKNLVMFFEHHSTRTRCSFEVAAFDQGARLTYLGPENSHIGYKESIKDSARVLGRIYHGMIYRGLNQKTVNILAQFSQIPVFNGLTKEYHPTQLLADLLTIQEYLPKKSFNQIKIAYVGDTNNNISHTLMEVAAICGIHLRLIGPSIYWPNPKFFLNLKELAKQHGGNITLTEDITLGVNKVDFIYTDMWISMGEKKENCKKNITMLSNYQVNMTMLDKTNNPNIKFLHCLPSIHNNTTFFYKKIFSNFNEFKNGMEVTDEVFESKHSLVFKQAENRLHTIKAVLVATLLTSSEILNY